MSKIDFMRMTSDESAMKKNTILICRKLTQTQNCIFKANFILWM